MCVCVCVRIDVRRWHILSLVQDACLKWRAQWFGMGQIGGDALRVEKRRVKWSRRERVGEETTIDLDLVRFDSMVDEYCWCTG